MKKILFGMFAATTLLLASCSQDDFQPAQNGNEANVMVTLTTPQIASRAYSDGTTATHLQYALYDVTSGTATRLDKYTVTDETINISKQINFKLVNGHTYRFVFWAAATNADGIYDVKFAEDGATFNIDYANNADFFKANLEDLDAFYVTEDVKVTGDVQKTFELRRPFAQINVGTNDYADAKAVGYTPDFSQLVVTNAYSTLDLFSGEVSNPTKVEYSWNVINREEKFPYEPETYEYMAMAYVLTGAEEAELVTVGFDYKNNNDGKVESRTFGSVPVQRNYRTNIFGSILTSDVDVNIIIEPAYYDPDYTYDEFLFTMANGGTVVLNDDVTIDNRMILDKNVVIDLNGHTIYGPAQNDATADGAFIVRNGANLTIKGEGKVETRGNYASILLWAQYGATITVEGGEFISHNGGEMAYTGGFEGGTIIINGGTFKPTAESGGKYSCLNCYDADFKAGIAKFIVNGGTFFNWNPELSSSEPAPANPKNWVSEGFHAVETTIDGETAYVVLPQEVGTIASTGTEAQEALASGDGVLLANDMTVQAQSGAYGKASAAFVVKGGQTLDGGGNTVTANGAFSNTYDSVITINDGTLKNLTVANGFRGVLVNFSNTGDVVLENVNVPSDSKCTYALNVNEGNGTYNFYATDCAFYGWSSWGPAAKQFTFVNCKFGAASYNVVKPYWNTLFENCEFEEGMYMDLSEFRANATLVFRNCTVNGQKLTKENHAQLINGHLEDDLTDWEGWEKVADLVFFE